MNEVGKPRLEIFDPDKFLDVVESMIGCDEVERALWMIDNPPGFFRDHPTDRMKHIREQLHRQTHTSVQYRGIYKDIDPNADFRAMTRLLRGDAVFREVKAMNKRGIKPNIMELAPGAMFIPKGLKGYGLEFTYERLSLDDDDHPFEKPDAPQENIFLAFEIIEHLENEWDIYRNYLKFGREARVVMLSTPLYTFDGGWPKWHSRELGHLRTYTPKEFSTKVMDMFQGYVWDIAADNTIVAIGRKPV